MQLANFFAGDPSSRQGAQVIAKNLDGDTRADLVAAVPFTPNPAGARVLAYAGKDIPSAGQPPVLHDYGLFTDPLGIYVG